MSGEDLPDSHMPPVPNQEALERRKLPTYSEMMAEQINPETGICHDYINAISRIHEASAAVLGDTKLEREFFETLEAALNDPILTYQEYFGRKRNLNSSLNIADIFKRLADHRDYKERIEELVESLNGMRTNLSEQIKGLFDKLDDLRPIAFKVGKRTKNEDEAVVPFADFRKTLLEYFAKLNQLTEVIQQKKKRIEPHHKSDTRHEQ